MPPRIDLWGFLDHVLVLGVVLTVGCVTLVLTQRDIRRGPRD